MDIEENNIKMVKIAFKLMFTKYTFSNHFEVDVDEDKIITKIKCVTGQKK